MTCALRGQSELGGGIVLPLSCAPRIISAAFSAIILAGACVLPVIRVGMIEASTTLRLSMQCTRSLLEPGEMIIYRTDRPYLFGFSRPCASSSSTSLRSCLANAAWAASTSRSRWVWKPVCSACSPASLRAHPGLLRLLRQTRGRALRRRRAGTALQHHRRANRRTPCQRPQRLLPAHRQTPHRGTTGRPGPQLQPRASASRCATSPACSPRKAAHPAATSPNAASNSPHRLLSSPQASGLDISEVAYRHGYSSQAHFARSFKARYGRTPSEVRGEG